MKETMFIKENGEVRVINSGLEAVKETTKSTSNPCFECMLGYSNKCPKMSDETKKNISEYEFITDGYQVYNKNGELESFAITKCNNYQEQPKKHRANTKESIKELKRLKESLLILYYGGADVEEALTIQSDIERRAYFKEMQQNYNKKATR